MNPIIKKLDKSIAPNPKYSYAPVKRGQTSYIITRCIESGFKASFYYGSIVIYNKKKYEEFKAIIIESLSLKVNNPEIRGNAQVINEDKKVLCIMTAQEDSTYIVEHNLQKVMYLQYKGEIPITQNYIIFNNHKDFEKAINRL